MLRRGVIQRKTIGMFFHEGGSEFAQGGGGSEFAQGGFCICRRGGQNLVKGGGSE